MARRPTIGQNPLDVYVPRADGGGPGPAPAPRPRERPQPPQPKRSGGSTRPKPSADAEAVRTATFHVPAALLEAVKDAVVALQGEPVFAQMTTFARDAFARHVAYLEKRYNRGKPFPRRSARAADRLRKGGRPVKARE